MDEQDCLEHLVSLLANLAHVTAAEPDRLSDPAPYLALLAKETEEQVRYGHSGGFI